MTLMGIKRAVATVTLGLVALSARAEVTEEEFEGQLASRQFERAAAYLRESPDHKNLPDDEIDLIAAKIANGVASCVMMVIRTFAEDKGIAVVDYLAAIHNKPLSDEYALQMALQLREAKYVDLGKECSAEVLEEVGISWPY